MKAITAGKKKSDRLDARTIADLLRCNLLPACYVLSPEMRDLRRLLRYRNLVVQESVRMQNKIAGLLMETGTPFVKEKLHGKKYFASLIQTLEEVPESVKDLLAMSRGAMEMFLSTQKRLLRCLLGDHKLVLCPTNNWTTMTGSTMLGSCHDLRPRLPSRKLTNSNFDSGRRPLGHRSRSPYEVRLC